MTRISIQQIPLTDANKAKLQSFLRAEGMAILRNVIESKVKLHTINAITPALESADSEPKLSEVNAELRDAHRFQTCLDILDKISNQSEFTVTKLS